MTGQRSRFGAHDRRPHLRRNFDDTIDTSRQVFRFRFRFAAGLGQMFVTDAVFAKQLGQYQSVELRPPRTGDAAHVAKKFNAVPPQQLEKIREWMAAVTDGIDY